MCAATSASACGSFGCLHGGLELVGGKSWHALDATHSLRSIPHREAQQRFGIGRIDDIDEIVVSLGVEDRLHLDAKLFELATRLVGTLGLLERPFGTERPEQNIPHGYLPDVADQASRATSHPPAVARTQRVVSLVYASRGRARIASPNIIDLVPHSTR